MGSNCTGLALGFQRAVALQCLSLSRGIIVGVVLLIWIIAIRRFGSVERVRQRELLIAFASLAPIAVSLMAAVHYSSASLDRFNHFGPHAIASMAIFGAAYRVLNPLLLPLPVHWTSLGATGLTALPSRDVTRLPHDPALFRLAIVGLVAVAKIAIRGFALMQVRENGRLLLLALIMFDLGNAVLLRIGRYEMGLGAAVSSRDQYVSWLCFAPSLGITIEICTQRLFERS